MTGAVALESEAARTSSDERVARYAFGGVAFELCHASRRWDLPPHARAFEADYARSRVAAHVSVCIERAPELARETGRTVDWSWDGDVGSVEAPRARALVRELGAGRFAGHALVAPSPFGVDSLVTALGAALVWRAGGAVLHAAAIRLADRAVLLVGPSGAGKSTAARQAERARLIGLDRAAVFPTPRGWAACGLPGGTPTDKPLEPSPALPLGGIFRVRHAERTQVIREPAVGAVSLLRESMLGSPSSSPEAALDAATRLASEVVVGSLSSVLGEDPTDALEGALS